MGSVKDRLVCDACGPVEFDRVSAELPDDVEPGKKGSSRVYFECASCENVVAVDDFYTDPAPAGGVSLSD